MKEFKWLYRKFTTSNMFFEVVKETHVIKNLYRLEVRLIDAGIFSSLTIDFGSDEIEEEIKNNRMKEVF